MSDDAFSPPEARLGWDADGERPIGPDIHVWVTTGMLLLLGVPLVLLGVLEAVVLPIAMAFDPELDNPLLGAAIGGAAGCVVGGIYGVMGLVPVIAAVGLIRQRFWGWVMALVAVSLTLTSPCCLPVGIYGMWALLRKHVRAGYGLG